MLVVNADLEYIQRLLGISAVVFQTKYATKTVDENSLPAYNHLNSDPGMTGYSCGGSVWRLSCNGEHG